MATAAGKGKAPPLLRVKVGQGNAIDGLNVLLLRMCVGEHAEFAIEAAAAYGAKGVPELNIKPHTNLVMEVILEAIEYN
jgi:FKBP-type peptidyl-prolyl cis-trans isomerase